MLLVAVMLLGIAYWAGGAMEQVAFLNHPEQNARPAFQLEIDTRRVESLQPEARAAGLGEGDVVETLNGEAFSGIPDWNEAELGAGPGELLEVKLRRADGSRGLAEVQLVAESAMANPAYTRSMRWERFVLFSVVPLLSLLIGCWVVFVRPSEPNAWLLLGLLNLPLGFFMLPGRAGAEWLVFRQAYLLVLQGFGGALLLLFAIYFPERSRLDRRVPWAKWLILLPAAVCGVAVVVGGLLELSPDGVPARWTGLLRGAETSLHGLELVCVALYLLLLIDKVRRPSSQDAKRRLRLLLAGTALGLLSPIVVFAVLPSMGFAITQDRVWIAYLAGLLFLLMPVTLAYVVVVQRAMDVRILLRLGTKYVLARASVWIAQAALAGIVIYLLIPVLERGNLTPASVWQIPLLIGLFVLIRFVLRKRAEKWVDRKFFREAYDSEHVLSELAQEVRRFTEVEPMLTLVSERVAGTLHIDRISFLLRAGKGFQLIGTVGFTPGQTAGLMVDERSSVMRQLTRSNMPVPLYRERPDAWYLLADDDERELLDEVGAELLLPLPGRSRLVGAMILGAKRSEAAYTKSDLKLLQVLATQTGQAIELSELAHSLARAAAQRERVAREMEIAREVQERLFPQVIPKVTWGSIAGACRSAQAIGGDYYDVFPLPDGRMGLAVGDVSGKGISAALLMAGLRASLRALMLDQPKDLGEMIGKINRLVYEASDTSKYATFFFAALDPKEMELTCVNAGHNPPMILRRASNGWRELKIEADGPVLGLLPLAAYTEQRVPLEPGDLLLMYTDGFSEAMTVDDREWGEEGIVAAVTLQPDLCAAQALEATFHGADRFTAGAPQHDDMTMLVIKMDGSLAT